MPTQIKLIKELSAENSNWHKKYPWFSLGQLVNVQEKINEEDFSSAAQFATIFFNDTQRLHWLIHEQVFNKNKILNELNVPISTEGMQTTPQPFPKKEHLQKVTAPNHLIAVAAVEENDAIQAQTPIAKDNVLIGDIVVHTRIDDLEDGNLSEIKKDEIISYVAPQCEPPNIYIQQPEEINTVESIVLQKEIVTEQNEELNAILPIDKKDKLIEHTAGEDKTDFDADSNETIVKAQSNIKAVLDGGDAMNITFEPYHTIDYFASQGIKVESKADDRLGKQLKSFTSWLKSMKRLPTTESAIADAESLHIHDKSLENTNVITEAMAAVLVKQGKKEQAIEIFKQLSLLHPEKSRYFAAQIEQIKN